MGSFFVFLQIHNEFLSLLNSIWNLLRLYRFRGHESAKCCRLSLQGTGYSHLCGSFINSNNFIKLFEESQNVGASFNIGGNSECC